MDDSSSRKSNSEIADLHSTTLRLQKSIESSEATALPCLLPSMPRCSSKFRCKDSATRSVGHHSNTEKADTKFAFNQAPNTRICSRTCQSTIGKLLEGRNVEYHYFIYRQTLSLISEADRAIALEILRWVTYAARPLYSWELLNAIESQIGISLGESDIERICGGLLNTGEDRRVCFVHFSLRDYLQSQSMENDTLDWNAVSGKSHEMITITCLRVLRPGDFLDFPNFPPFVNQSERPNAFKFYARQYWKFHYNQAEHQSSYLPGMLHEKLQSSWRKGYGTFGSNFAPDQTSPGIRNQRSSSAIEFINAALQEGARSGMVRLVKLELEMGASPNASDNLGMTPLHYAAAAGNCEVMNLLIDYGGNSDITSKSGETALFHALQNRHAEAVQLLLARGLASADKSSGNDQNQNEKSLTQPFHQKLSLAVSLSICCSGCRDVRSHYVLSKPSNNEENDEMWPPIHVMDELISLAKCGHLAVQEDNQVLSGTVISEQRTLVKWFPGISMYQALGVAAKSGMDEVLKLLILAGNDIEFLERNASLNKLISKMSIS